LCSASPTDGQPNATPARGTRSRATINQGDKNDPDGVKELGRLTKVYWEAYQNPPEGVIGVGAITYAQEMLIAAQINEEDH
jgi:hypothetical protein